MSKIALLLSPGFADWEYGLIAGTGGPFYGLDVQIFGTATGATVSQGGLGVTLSQGPGALTAWQPDVLAIVGGTLWESPQAPDLTARLAELHSEGTTIAGICGGTLAMARAGVLAHARHTSNGAAFLRDNAPGYEGGQHYTDSAKAVTDGRIITAPGTAPASFAAAVFAAADLPADTVVQFRDMMAAEHR